MLVQCLHLRCGLHQPARHECRRAEKIPRNQFGLQDLLPLHVQTWHAGLAAKAKQVRLAALSHPGSTITALTSKAADVGQLAELRQPSQGLQDDVVPIHSLYTKKFSSWLGLMYSTTHSRPLINIHQSHYHTARKSANCKVIGSRDRAPAMPLFLPAISVQPSCKGQEDTFKDHAAQLLACQTQHQQLL